MKSISKLLLSQFLFLFIFSCSNEYQIVSNEHKVIEVKNEQDSTIIDIILPYKTQLDKEMNQIICYTKSELKKGKPESKLGNFICDLSLLKADGMADICIFNNGGLRNIIASGNITVRDIYKVMPFENELVILDLNKKEYYDLLKYVANSGGEPIGGVNIIAKKDTIITAFNSNEIIRVLTTDYLANGGDNMKFFINKEQKKVGIKLRDAMINYCIEKDTLDIQIDKRLMFEYEE
jgi:2',3'-cyclic-nucleotide 2'-phosphodiesterase (5'-nucleotidase family)